MTHTKRSFVATTLLFFAILLCMSFWGCSENDAILPVTSDITGTEADDTSKDNGNASADQDSIAAEFAVFSDSHIGKGLYGAMPDDKLIDALNDLSRLMPDCDAVLFAGDLTNLGTDTEYAAFLDIWNKNKPNNAKLLSVIGNHEYFRDGKAHNGGESEEFAEECKSAYKSFFGELNHDTVIGGIHFIGVSPDDSAGNYESSEEYIITHVEAAAKEDPNKPIVIFAHQGMGVYYDGGAGKYTDKTLKFLKDYPQVIVFSGHMHLSLYDPRMIQQFNYTTVQTSTVGADLWNYKTMDDGQPENKDLVSEGLLVKITDNGIVTITRYDFLRNSVIGEPWVIDIPAVVESKDAFNYTAGRVGDAKFPKFPEDSKVEIKNISADHADISFPSAAVDDSVSEGIIVSYNIYVQDKGNSVTVYDKTVNSEYHMGDKTQKELTYRISGLKADRTYQVKVTAKTSMDKTAYIMSERFKTKDSDSSDDAQVLLYADYTKGEYKDLSQYSLNAELFGTPISENGEAKLDKESAYGYLLTEEIYKQIPSSFTLEFDIFICEDQTYPWGYVTLVGNTEAGGFGVSYLESGHVQLEVNIGGAYKTVKTEAKKGEWIHFVGTYNGSELCIYLNGEKKAAAECSGDIKHVSSVSRKLIVGADVNGGGGVQTLSNISVRFVRLYDIGLSDKAVNGLYTEQRN